MDTATGMADINVAEYSLEGEEYGTCVSRHTEALYRFIAIIQGDAGIRAEELGGSGKTSLVCVSNVIGTNSSIPKARQIHRSPHGQRRPALKDADR